MAEQTDSRHRASSPVRPVAVEKRGGSDVGWAGADLQPEARTPRARPPPARRRPRSAPPPRSSPTPEVTQTTEEKELLQRGRGLQQPSALLTR